MSTLYMMMAITKRSIQNRLKELYKRNGLEVTFMTLARGTAIWQFAPSYRHHRRR